MEKLPITVVIPTYNRAKFLQECLESVSIQTHPPTQVIVVDDGSEDQTESVCRQSSLDVRYIYLEHCGVSTARNRGIQAATTAWIALLDSDDLWQAQKLERQWAFVQEHPECRILQTEEVWIRKGRRVNQRAIHHKPSGWIFGASLEHCLVSPSAVLIHREVFADVGSFDEALPACEDYDLWLRMALYYPIYTLREPLTIKQGGHADQLSAQWGLDRYRVRSLQKLLDGDQLNKRQREQVIKNLRRRCEILINGFEKRGKADEANIYRDVLNGLS